MKMKLSCLPVSLFGEINTGKMPIEEFFALAEEIGLDGIDISMNYLHCHSAVYVREMRERFEKQKLPVIMCATYPDFTNPDPMQREREVAYFNADIALCDALHIPYLRILAGQAHPGVDPEQGIAWAVECMKRCAAFAEKTGVTLVYEDHGKPGAWDYIDMTYPPELFLKTVEGIRDTSIGINFDIGNIVAAGEDPVKIAKMILPKIKTIHVSDMEAFGTFKPVLVGTGATPLKEVFRTLKEGGFDGWYCIEEASNTGFDGIRKAVANTRRIWEEA